MHTLAQTLSAWTIVPLEIRQAKPPASLQLQVANQAGSAVCKGVIVPLASINLPLTIHR